MKPVIQGDRTGCGIASVAALTRNGYAHVKRIAGGLGIVVTDSSLWSDPAPMRRLLAHFRFTANGPLEFTSWETLPDRALLAIKWHEERTGPAWHWVVFVRNNDECFVLDSKKALRTHHRTDFGRIKPKWFIAVSR